MSTIWNVSSIEMCQVLYNYQNKIDFHIICWKFDKLVVFLWWSFAGRPQQLWCSCFKYLSPHPPLCLLSSVSYSFSSSTSFRPHCSPFSFPPPFLFACASRVSGFLLYFSTRVWPMMLPRTVHLDLSLLTWPAIMCLCVVNPPIFPRLVLLSSPLKIQESQ